MTFERVTFTGPAFDDHGVLRDVPPPLAALLVEDNGVVAYGGGLHIRGACLSPHWHSLRQAWRGPLAFYLNYPAILPTDIPFAEDALGDQFLLRDGMVLRLAGETGEIESLTTDLPTFLHQVAADPVGVLSLEPLLAFEQTGGRLEPGQLLSVYPPYCTSSSGERSYRALASRDRLDFLASLARRIRDLPDGAQLSFEITP